MRRGKSGGFTLIELVMVIVILGVLAAIALPRFIDLQKNAAHASASGELGGLRAAAATFYASTAVRNAARYPSTKALVTSMLNAPLTVLGISIAGTLRDWKYTSTSGRVDASGSWTPGP
ncbi:MAG: prepilin-type N-terminal cleavage/methylation domain-containing protein [Candidatus Omnitrophica bacterium]|nr:prepilin-type N-terminal cleavage/methylation domain-containing protein [Candidatus Omnitrophota bacterium]